MNDKKYLYISLIVLAIALSVYFYRKNIPNVDMREQTVDSNNEDAQGEITIDLNTADRNMLVALPGIGEITADKIIEYRTQHNGFDSIAEIMNISGIKEKKFNQIKDYIYVSH